MKPITVELTGPSSYRAHLVAAPRTRLARRPYPPALCGTTPAKESEGWKPCRHKKLCPRCKFATTAERRADDRAVARMAGELAKTERAAKKAAAPPKKTVAPRLHTDVSADAYESRLITAMERTTEKRDTERCMQQTGRDGGGGWVILRTDGSRALLKQGTSETKTLHPITQADPPTTGITLTPQLETALRTVWATIDRKRPTVWLRINAAKRHVVIESVLGTLEPVPIEGTLATTRFGVNLRWLLDGFGRGGRLGYVVKGKEAARQPLVLDTPDGLRYVLMPVVPPKVIAATAPTPAAPTPPAAEGATA